jgi:hypothetical protein
MFDESVLLAPGLAGGGQDLNGSQLYSLVYGSCLTKPLRVTIEGIFSDFREASKVRDLWQADINLP